MKNSSDELGAEGVRDGAVGRQAFEQAAGEGGRDAVSSSALRISHFSQTR